MKTAIIIGAGPAGLTAAYELITKTDIKPIIYEASDDIGGISKTVNYKGNRIDIGGHRFFSKSDKIMDWWKNILPLQNGIDPEKTDKIMLIRNRLSRIFFLRKFFDYPISLNYETIKNLGIKRLIKIGFSYINIRLFPIKEEKSLEDFFINRFGKELYLTFFKDYTEKVWGTSCKEIKPEWGAQRIKGLSITAAIKHAVKSIFSKQGLEQKNTETSLINKFMYPKLGPGQLWEEVLKIIKEKGGEIYLNNKITGIKSEEDKITKVSIKDKTGEIKTQKADYFFSTMPVKDLIQGLNDVPEEVKRVARGLIYRDFMTVGLLLKKMKVDNIQDNWIYIQERDVKIGRIQVFNNWSPYLVNNKNNIWLGLEYFCNEGDELWSKTDKEFAEFAIDELEKIDMIEKEDVIDNIVIKMPKTYPAYFGSYDEFNIIRNFTDKFDNLFLIGRNGMHRYNNSDHSMMTAIVAVENIINNRKDKSNIWNVNTEEEYHEEKEE